MNEITLTHEEILASGWVPVSTVENGVAKSKMHYGMSFNYHLKEHEYIKMEYNGGSGRTEIAELYGLPYAEASTLFFGYIETQKELEVLMGFLRLENYS
jgi:hypothetical protein